MACYRIVVVAAKYIVFSVKMTLTMIVPSLSTVTIVFIVNSADFMLNFSVTVCRHPVLRDELMAINSVPCRVPLGWFVLASLSYDSS